MAEEVHERLQTARTRAGYSSATDAARSFGFNENTYRSHENGERGLKMGRAAKYAEAFQVSLSWLMFGTGNSHEERTLIIDGIINNNNRVAIFKNKDLSVDMDASIILYSENFSLLINDDSLYPRYNIGDIVICWNTAGDELLPTRPAEGLVSLVGDSFCFGTLLPGDEDHATLEIMGRPPARGLRIADFFQVRIVLRAGSYKGADIQSRVEAILGSTKRTETD